MCREYKFRRNRNQASEDGPKAHLDELWVIMGLVELSFEIRLEFLSLVKHSYSSAISTSVKIKNKLR